MRWLKRKKDTILNQVKDLSIPSKRALGEMWDNNGYSMNTCHPDRAMELKMESGKIGLFKFKCCTYGGTTDWHYNKWEFIGYKEPQQKD